METPRTLAYPRYALALSLALAAAVAWGAIALGGVPAPSPALTIYGDFAAAGQPSGGSSCGASTFAESFACADGVDNDCDGDVDCDDLTCAYSAACGCPWWDVVCAAASG